MQYKDERDDPIYKKKNRRRKWVLFGFVVLFFVLLAVAANYNVVVRWFIPTAPLTITLDSPVHNNVTNDSTPFFNWTSAGGISGHRYHVWYIDNQNTFNTPLLRAIYVSEHVNYTANPLLPDGDWYWRVEATDNVTVKVSDTWHLIITHNLTNTFPALLGAQVLPVNGTTHTYFIYSVVYVDADNDTATNMTVYINGTVNAMTERDPTDTDTTDGKIYWYNTTMPVGTHNYSFYCSDGQAIFATAPQIGPVVTLYVPPAGGGNGSGGGGGGIEPKVKMNKITLQPDNVDAIQGDAFTGSLSITEESYNGEYEVFWYVYLVDENGTEITYNQGSLAIYTTVVVPYDLDTLASIAPGSYRIIAKTYDMPRENITATQLGMDEIPVTVKERPLPLLPDIKNIFDTLADNIQLIIILGLLLGFIGLLLFAFHKKKYILIIAASVCIMIDLILIGIVPQLDMTLFGLPLFVFGAILLTPHRVKLIKNKHFAIALGASLVTLGILVYLSGLIWF